MEWSLLVFLLVFIGVVAGHQLVSGWMARDSERVRQRLAEEFGSEVSPANSSLLFKDLDKLSLDAPPTLDPDAEALPTPAAEPTLGEQWTTLLAQAHLPLTPKQLAGIAAILAVAVGLPVSWFFGLLLGAPAAALALAAPLIYVYQRANGRREKYLKQLPNAFELMARVIRAGQSVPQSLQAVADAFEDPLANAFNTCIQQQNLGLRPEVSFQQMAERSGILELRIFAMAMLIQRETGGNLSEVLERLAGVVRARLKLKQQVRTLTAEGRLQGWTLVVLPFLVLAVMMVINRPYVEVLFQHPGLLVMTAASMGMGILWIRSIVNIEG